MKRNNLAAITVVSALLAACGGSGSDKPTDGLDLIASEGEGQKFIVNTYKSCMKRENDIKQCFPKVSYEANVNGHGGLLADVMPRIEKYEETKNK